jgi:hypothetical protein
VAAGVRRYGRNGGGTDTDVAADVEFAACDDDGLRLVGADADDDPLPFTR